jgi:hypothetical protein
VDAQRGNVRQAEIHAGDEKTLFGEVGDAMGNLKFTDMPGRVDRIEIVAQLDGVYCGVIFKLHSDGVATTGQRRWRSKPEDKPERSFECLWEAKAYFDN